MNLAEIRKKARQEKAGQCSPTAAIPSPVRVTCAEHAEIMPLQEPLETSEPLCPEDAVVQKDAPESNFSQVDAVEAFDPLAIILAGRRAAGTAADTVSMPREQSKESPGDVMKYLRFRVADEDYGVNLLEIREIIKLRAITEVPRMPDFVAGVISLRGAIIPVIDLGRRLGMPAKEMSGQERIIIAKKGESSCGLLVDEVFHVIALEGEEIEKAPQVLEGVDREFVMGIGRHQELMLILLDLENIMNVSLR